LIDDEMLIGKGIKMRTLNMLEHNMKNAAAALLGKATRRGVLLAPFLWAACINYSAADSALPFDRFSIQTPVHAVGQSATLLPDGRWLLVGGKGSSGSEGLIQIEDISDPLHPVIQNVSGALGYPRSQHTTTVLPDGTVLILGGSGPDGAIVTTAEIFDPQTQALKTLPDTGLIARAGHTATLLTNGLVLVAGGVSAAGTPIQASELLNTQKLKAELLVAPLGTPRASHQAALLANGQGLVWGGNDISGQPLDSGELYNPLSTSFGAVNWWDPSALPPKDLTAVAPQVQEILPASGAVDVPVDMRIAVRFSEPVRMQTLSEGTVTLVGPGGAVSGKVVGAESGMLVFFTPKTDLLPGTTYTLFLNGVADNAGRRLPFTSFSFNTHRFQASAGNGSAGTIDIKITPPSHKKDGKKNSSSNSASILRVLNKQTYSPKDKDKKKDEEEEDYEDWIPQDENRHGDWRVLGLPHDPVFKTAKLMKSSIAAADGVTAVTGQVLRLNGKPLAGVAVSIDSETTVTDDNGGFLIEGASPGTHQLKVDGTTAIVGGRHYTKHFIEVNVVEGKTASMPGPIYLPRVNPDTEVSIASPSDEEVVLTHPDIPGLEVRIPKGAVLREYDGKIVTKLSITPIPVDRAPYPAPIDFSVYFTLQPGGAFVDGDASNAIKIIYPNYLGLAPGSSVNFWNYDPNGGGWKVYGTGFVSDDGKKIMPNGTVGFRQVMTFGYGIGGGGGSVPPSVGPPPGGCTNGGDPVDCATGLFLHSVTDFSIPDVMPISVTRTYRQNDLVNRQFGIGTGLSYAMYLYTSSTDSLPSVVDLILSDGGRVHYSLLSGNSVTNAIWKNIDSPTAFFGSTLEADTAHHGFTITMTDHTVMSFTTHPYNQLVGITDPNGNTLTITLSNGVSGNVTRVTSPSGRYVRFTYDGTNSRITDATDNLGRNVHYDYEQADPTTWRLIKATDPAMQAEQYGYDTSNRMRTVTDKRGNVMVTNDYDANGRVHQQTLADNALWIFDYTMDSNNKVTQTNVTDPRGYVRQDSFNSDGYLTKEIRALGDPKSQTTIFQRDATNLLLSVTDPLNRVTSYTYDPFGNVTTVTRLSGTANAVTDTYTYDPASRKLASYTDSLTHKTQLGYDALGNLTSVTDPLTHTLTIDYNGQGLPTTVTDALLHKTQIDYQQADVSSVTDALGRSTTAFTDAIGRLRSVTDALGNRTQISYDPMNRVQQIVDPASGITTLHYDEKGNLLSVVDARNVGSHQYEYDLRNWTKTHTDPLGNSEGYLYDGLGNLKKYTDRKGQATQYTYDPLNRLDTITFQDGSTIKMTWDVGNRPVQAVDSLNGTVAWQFDPLNCLTQETTAQGQVNYDCDSAGRRKHMTVVGAPQITYNYDDANRLLSITQATSPASSVIFTYDDANRRATVTLPNGIVQTFGFSDADELTSLSYAKGANPLGSLTYAYDDAGHRISRLSTLDLTGLPATTGAAGDAATYAWDVRNQLASLTGTAPASFSYDALGRRSSRTVNGTSTAFAYDGMNLVQEQRNASVLANYLTGLGVDEVYSRTDSTATQSYLTDALGSVTSLTSASGIVSTRYKYDAYGNTSTTGAVSQNSLQYAGRENDGTGLYFNRARYYSPIFERFISDDPIGLSGGINTYSYVSSNPVALVDPSGLAGMVVYFNGYQVDTGMGFSLPLGHAGVVAIDNNTGASQYFDFGRYGGKYGDVRGPFDVGTLSFDKSGMPTASSLNAMRASLSHLFGKDNTATLVYNRKADASKIIQFALNRQGNTDKNPYTLDPFSKNPLNFCDTFAIDALAAGLK
jgi:RHS repeat-associated protein